MSAIATAKLLASVMSDPEAFAKQFMSQMGFDPAKIMQEIDGFRNGMQQTILHFNAQLVALREQQAAILEAVTELRTMQTAQIVAPVMEQHHERRD